MTRRPAAFLPLVATLAWPATAPAEADGEAYRSKKDRRLDAKARAAAVAPDALEAERTRWRTALDRRIGKPPPRVINFYNVWTREYLAISADPKGDDPSIPEDRGNRFLRCRFTHQAATMDPQLFDVLAKAARRFKSNRVHVISAYRSPKHNLNLRKKGREVARESKHTTGKAVDFRIPGVPTPALRRWAMGLRLGGVGFYPQSRFIHVDTGPVRTWAGR